MNRKPSIRVLVLCALAFSPFAASAAFAADASFSIAAPSGWTKESSAALAQ